MLNEKIRDHRRIDPKNFINCAPLSFCAYHSITRTKTQVNVLACGFDLNLAECSVAFLIGGVISQQILIFELLGNFCQYTGQIIQFIHSIELSAGFCSYFVKVSITGAIEIVDHLGESLSPPGIESRWGLLG